MGQETIIFSSGYKIEYQNPHNNNWYNYSSPSDIQIDLYPNKSNISSVKFRVTFNNIQSDLKSVKQFLDKYYSSKTDLALAVFFEKSGVMVYRHILSTTMDLLSINSLSSEIELSVPNYYSLSKEITEYLRNDVLRVGVQIYEGPTRIIYNNFYKDFLSYDIQHVIIKHHDQKSDGFTLKLHPPEISINDINQIVYVNNYINQGQWTHDDTITVYFNKPTSDYHIGWEQILYYKPKSLYIYTVGDPGLIGWKSVVGKYDSYHRRYKFEIPLVGDQTGYYFFIKSKNKNGSLTSSSNTGSINVYPDSQITITYPSGTVDYGNFSAIKWNQERLTYVSKLKLKNYTSYKTINLNINSNSVSAPSDYFYSYGKKNTVGIEITYKSGYTVGSKQRKKSNSFYVNYGVKKETGYVDITSPQNKQTNVGSYDKTTGKITVPFGYKYSGGSYFTLKIYNNSTGSLLTTYNFTGSGTTVTNIPNFEFQPLTTYKFELYLYSDYNRTKKIDSDSVIFTTIPIPISEPTLTKPSQGERVDMGSDQSTITVNFSWTWSDDYYSQNDIYYDFYYVYQNRNDPKDYQPYRTFDYYGTPIKQNLTTNSCSITFNKNDILSKQKVSSINDQEIIWWVVVKHKTLSNVKTYSMSYFGFNEVLKTSKLPTKPILIYPQNGQKDIDVSNITFTWNQSTDSDGDPVGYDIYFGKSSQQLTKLNTSPLTNTSFTYTQTLDEITKYYWKVIQGNMVPQKLVVQCGKNENGQVSGVYGWTDIVQVQQGLKYTVGLKSDGTVVQCGRDDWGQVSGVYRWTNIVQVQQGSFHTVGLKSDGTVVQCGWNYYGSVSGVSGWTDIVQVQQGDYYTVGLKSDGTVVQCGFDGSGQVSGVSGWTDIVQVQQREYHTVGLKSDGTVIQCGNNNYGQVSGVSGWTNIVQVQQGDYHTVGLKQDGTVVQCGVDNGNPHYDYGQVTGVSGWTDIIQVQQGSFHTIGLKSDGTVIQCGRNNYGEVSGVYGWTDIVQVQQGGYHTVGLKKKNTFILTNEISSDLWSFTTKKVSQPPTQFNLIYPQYNQRFNTHNTSISIPFEWSQSSDPDGGNITYNLYYKKQSSSSYTKKSGITGTTKSVTFSLPSYSGSIQWYVEQVDDEGNKTKTTTSLFKINYVNNPPNSFDLISPTNGDVIDLIDDMTTLNWESTTDPDGDPVVYDLYIGESSNSFWKVQGGLSKTNYTIKLNYDKTYYWYVVQKDNRGQTRKSVTWSFTTNPENQPPLPFSLVSPQNESEDVDYHTIDFEWTSTTDPEGDPVTYDLYIQEDQQFSTGLITHTDLTETTFTVNELKPETTYFWKVIQKDQEGRERSSDVWYFTTRTNLYKYTKSYMNEYGLYVPKTFKNSINGVEDIEVKYELINGYESNVFLTYRNNEVVNRTQYIPYINFGDILHKEHNIKLNDTSKNLLSEFTLDLDSITNDNVIFEIDKPDDKTYYVKNTRYDYVVKNDPQSFVETYEKQYELENPLSFENTQPLSMGSIQLGQSSGDTLSSDLIDIYKKVVDDLRNIYVSEMKIIVSETTQKEMLKRIKELYDYKEPIITFLVNHVFHLSDLSLENIETRIQLPQLWKQYVVQTYQKDLQYSEIYQIIFDYYKLQEKNYMNLKFIDYVSGYGSFNLKLFMDLREKIDDFTKQFDPYFYNLIFDLPTETYNEILDNLVYQYKINDDGNVEFKQKTDIMKMLNRLIYQEKVLNGEQTINQQLVYDDVNELVDYLNYFDLKGYKSDLLYSFYYNKEDLIDLLQRIDGIELVKSSSIYQLTNYKEEIDKIIIYPNEQNVRLFKDGVKIICNDQTQNTYNLVSDRDGILYDENGVDYGYVMDDKIVLNKNVINTSQNLIDYVSYKYDDSNIYYNKLMIFDELINKNDYLFETETQFVVKVIVPLKYRIDKNSLVLKIDGIGSVYDVDGYIQLKSSLETKEDYDTQIIGWIDYNKGILYLSKSSLNNITLDDFVDQNYRLLKIDTKIGKIIDELTKQVDMENQTEEFKNRMTNFLYTKYNPNDFYSFTKDRLLKLHIEVYYRMILNKIFMNDSLYDDKYIVSKDQVFPIYFYKKPNEVFVLNDLKKLFRKIDISLDNFEKLLRMLEYDDSLYSFKIKIYPVEDQVEYFKELYPDVDILESYDVYNDENDQYSVVVVRLDDVNQITQDKTIELYENIQQKRRLVISLSNSLITVKLNDEFNTDDYYDVMYDQRNYILYNMKELKQSKIPYFNMYEITENGVEVIDKNTEYLNYFIPFNINQQYSVGLFDRENMRVKQNSDEDNIQIIVPDEFNFLINQSGQLYKLTWR